MKKQNHQFFWEGIVSELSGLTICFVMAFTVVISLSYIIAILSKIEMTDDVVLSFYLFSFIGWIVLFLSAKKSQRVRLLLGIDFTRKPINVRKLILTITIISVLLGCFAIAYALTSTIFGLIGFLLQAQYPRVFWGLGFLFWILLLVLVKKLLLDRLPVDDHHIKRQDILQGIAMTLVVAALIAGGVVVAYFLAFVLYAAYMGHTVPENGATFFTLLWRYSSVAFFFFLRWYFRQSPITKHIRLLSEVMKALDCIARGDFSVRLNHDLKENEPFETLVKSINEMTLSLEQMENMRQEFISNVSHEIQSPLATINGFARLLYNDELSPEKRNHFLNIIETETMRLSRLSENLLKLAALETDSVKFEPKPYRIDKQLRALLLGYEPQWNEKNITMEASLDTVTLTADEDMMSQVWINLIHNSIKFTPDGGSIQVELHEHGKSVICKISDTGIGIAEDAQKHIFERFYKADKSRERTKKGSGLGLAIAKTIIEMHGGTITVYSKLGAGTTFTVSLPVSPPM
ncbi:sensor histidine kinase [Parasphaerochaeta coccoides]|uniref:histidine kinase n=1 Tax=Parasphaerochaeta coccoides (strain ATCC BAA-1237 / DSM 17374 / SPN1) TaxID=760011 RepID=F4GHT4_PARC1|nr:HAMP domain-containing sensor histidine kinase [Parasphaerochaeta coccoides]AEC01622.1 integral membrane sensor signal transduction histidine kinase [Parasphaerochaeta coccoides DSM 17374]